MSSPHVAGAAALYLQRDPTMTPKQVLKALLKDASRDKIERTSIQFSPNLLLYTGNI
jgi:subtilisin family serine protease